MGGQARDPQLAALDRLVGTWKVTGGAEGEVTYRWLDGGHFLVQDVALEQYGEGVRGMEVIGRERPFGAAEPSSEIKSRFYGNGGETLEDRLGQHRPAQHVRHAVRVQGARGTFVDD